METTKQVIVFRRDLLEGRGAVGRGEFAAQCAHASMGALLKLFTIERGEYRRVGSFGEIGPGQFFTRYSLEFKDGALLDGWLDGWLEGSFTRVVLGVDGERGLLDIENELKRLNEWDLLLIPYVSVSDSGKTGFHGAPAVTCLGIGPYESGVLDRITGNLPLL